MKLFPFQTKCLTLLFLSSLFIFNACTEDTSQTEVRLDSSGDCSLTSTNVDHFQVIDSVSYHNSDLFTYSFNSLGLFREALEYDNALLESTHKLSYTGDTLKTYSESWANGDVQQFNFYYQNNILVAIQDIYAFNLGNARSAEEQNTIKYHRRLREIGNKREANIANQYEIIYTLAYEAGNELPVGAIDNFGGVITFQFNENKDLTQWTYRIQEENYSLEEIYSYTYDDKTSILRNKLKHPLVGSSFLPILDLPQPSFYNNVLTVTHSWTETENEVIIDSGEDNITYDYSYNPTTGTPILIMKSGATEEIGNRNYQLNYDCR